MNNLGVIASGLDVSQGTLSALATDVANTNTDGYGAIQSQTANVAAALARPTDTTLENTVLPPDLITGSGADMAPGTLSWSNAITPSPIATNLAIDGTGFFVVTLPGGGTAYTRNGAFTLNAQGHLALADGSVLTGIAKAPADSAVAINAKGVVTATRPNGAVSTLGTIRIATFANAGGLTAMADTAYTPNATSGPAQVAAPGTGNRGTIQTSALNASGSSLDRLLPSLLQAQEAYSANTDALHAESTVLQTTDNLHV